MPNIVSRPAESLGIPVRQPIGYGNPNPVLYSGPGGQNPYLQNWKPAAPSQTASPATAPAAAAGGGVGSPSGGDDMGGLPPSDMKSSGGNDSPSMQALAQAMSANRDTPMLGADGVEDTSPMLGKGTPRNRSGALAALAGMIY